jgi:tetratricopeptide (TPR) repeat protein
MVLGMGVEDESSDDEELVAELAVAREKINESNQVRLQANELFGQDRFEDAIKMYDEAVAILDSFEINDPGMATHQRNARILCCLNKASCFLKLEQFEQAVEMSTWVLSCQPQHPKALYRRAQAYLALDQNDAALADVEKALGAHPNNEMLITLRAQIVQKM